METQYYDGTKILSMNDINGNKPEIYMVTGNRTGGKTTYFNRLCVNRFKDSGSKFMLMYRYNYELDEVANKFFKDIKGLFFHNDTMTSKRCAKGVYHELYLNETSCGYAVSLNNADMIKKMSHLFSDTDRMVFDEFQSETNHYCVNELEKLISIHTSVARGQGKQVRYVPIYMMSNAVSVINPYFTAMGVSGRLRDDTKFLRGDGFVLEQCFIETASLAQKESGFNRAFSNNKYVEYSAQNVYLNDNKAFVGKPEGVSRYICTLRFGGRDYAVREYAEHGFLYCDDKADATFPNRISVTTDDHNINYVMLRRNDFFINNLRYIFEKGCFRFKDLKCKEVVLSALSY